jgi:hypothetical protein
VEKSASPLRTVHRCRESLLLLPMWHKTSEEISFAKKKKKKPAKKYDPALVTGISQVHMKLWNISMIDFSKM